MIKDYIVSLEVKALSAEDIIKGNEDYHRFNYNLGISDEEEIVNTYVLLKYLADNKKEIWFFGQKLDITGNKLKDKVNVFGSRIINPFSQHIERYFRNIMIDMGYDENQKFTVIVNGGQPQLNIANDSASITATQNNNIGDSNIDELVAKIKSCLDEIDDAEIKQDIVDSIETIQDEINSQEPKKRNLNLAKSMLESVLPKVTGAIGLTSSIMTIIQFASQVT